MENIIFFNNQEEFTLWLDQNSTQCSEVWVGYFKIHTWKWNFSWSESVDAALCFGWIDGIRKTIDEESYKIRFTPRKINSVWSAVNVKKVEELIKLWKMRPAGMHVFHNRSDEHWYSSQHRNVQILQEYEDTIKVNAAAWEFFNNLSPSSKRDSIWWLMSAKREETQRKRLEILIECSQAGLKIPMLQKK